MHRVLELVHLGVLSAAVVAGYVYYDIFPGWSVQYGRGVDLGVVFCASVAMYLVARLVLYILCLPLYKLHQYGYLISSLQLICLLGLVGLIYLQMTDQMEKVAPLQRYFRLALGKQWYGIFLQQLKSIRSETYLFLRLCILIGVIQAVLTLILAPLRLARSILFGRRKH